MILLKIKKVVEVPLESVSTEGILLASEDKTFSEDLIYFDPDDENVQEASKYNYKIKCIVNNDSPVFAELDSDSHISILSEAYFRRIKKLFELEFLNEKPIHFKGMGSSLKSNYPPLMLNLQIGKVLLRGRFIISDHLKTSPLLLGSDFMLKNRVWVTPFSNGKWYCYIGTYDNPIGKTEAMITSKIVLSTVDHVTLKPFETKRIRVEISDEFLNKYFDPSFSDYSLNPVIEQSDGFKETPLQIVSDLEKDSIEIFNNSFFNTELCRGWEIGSTKKDFSTKDLSLNFQEAFEDPDFEIEQLIEPGLEIPTVAIIDKHEELNHVKNHKDIPEELKPKLLAFLEENPELFSGAEFSEKTFPPDVFSHEVELTTDLKELKCKPFPTVGVRLEQLKEAIYDLVDKKVLEPGDSEFLSPCFFVTKKPGAGSTAFKGRLCYDYRKINSYVKAKNYPLTNYKIFFSQMSKFRVFCLLDICNAFLSIPLTPEAKKYLAITTPFGIFLPTRTPFGLKTSPSAFCYALNIALGDLPYSSRYMDDILIGGENNEDMLNNLIEVMKRLAKFNLKIRLSKTTFFTTEAKVLGVIFSAHGRKIDPAKIKAIQDFGPIDSLKKVQCFLGMLAFLSSFICHFSTACYPLYALLKDQKKKPFALTKEAMEAYEKIKECLSSETLLYHPDFEKDLYLSVDSSNVGIGSFLYQLDVYPKTKEGEQEMLSKLGFVPEQMNTKYLIPGISPGKNTPLVDFLQDDKNIKDFDRFNTLDNNKTMTEKISSLNDKVFHLRPVSWFSRCYTTPQVLRYSIMEKEFLALLLSVLNFKDYIEASKISFILTDSQPILWALRHKESNLKLSRWILKLFEYQINIIITHIAGHRNNVADFLSRIYFVDEPRKSKNELNYRSAQHIIPSFKPLQVLTIEDILKGFNSDQIQPCSSPTLCHLNANGFLYGNKGPFEPKFTCLNDDKPLPESKKLLLAENFGFTAKGLEKNLSLENIYNHQQADIKIKEIYDKLLSNEIIGRYFIRKGIVCKGFKDPTHCSVIYLPEKLVPFAIASFHLQTHGGSQKMLNLLKLKFYWKNMLNDITEFCKGCVLCSIYKNDNKGKTEIVVPKLVQKPLKSWMMDVVTGLPVTNGFKGYINFVDLYSGYTIPVAIKTETSAEFAKIIENNIIKQFNCPEEISSDNAQNLQGPEVRKLLNFYNIKQRFTTPYSPESHGLVEVQNRYITELTRIFVDQFQTSWPNVLTISALVINSVPRTQLLHHSPHFIVFGQEPFNQNNFKTVDEKFLDINDFVKNAINNKIYIKLIREFLLFKRNKRNDAIKRTYKSFPKNSLIYVKDMM